VRNNCARGRLGFCLAELLVASVLALMLAAGVLAIVEPASGTSKARAAAIDIEQRLRAAAEALGGDVTAAGSGPANGVQGQAFGLMAPSIMPFRVGTHGDPPGTARTDALTLLSSAPVAVSTTLRLAWMPGGGPAEIALDPGCPPASASCGLSGGDVVLLVDGRGQADLFRVDAVAGVQLTLTPRGAVSGRSFPAGSFVVPVVVTTYYLKTGTPDGEQIMSGDGDLVDMPLVDHVTAFRVELMAEPRPPAVLLLSPGVRATYGPSPPPASEDDPRDDWPAGENCTFQVTGAGQAGRLPVLREGTALVPLGVDALTDGPWCPDASSPWRYDADLLRVRAVRFSVSAEAGRLEVRGRQSAFFLHTGLAREPSAAAADRHLLLDVVPRALQAGR
jgi:hypothetical protein